MGENLDMIRKLARCIQASSVKTLKQFVQNQLQLGIEKPMTLIDDVGMKCNSTMEMLTRLFYQCLFLSLLLSA